MSATPKGRLYLVPAPLDFGCDTQAPLQDVMPLGTLQIAATLSCWICENAKSTRAYLKRVGEVMPLGNVPVLTVTMYGPASRLLTP